MNRLSFTLGPVQAFVAQARRTRDLWAGSFLLSWLSGQAMQAVINAGGTITFPSVSAKGEITDPLLKAIGGQIDGRPPFIGSLPNRFAADIPDRQIVREAERAVRDAWKRLSQTVYSRFVAPVCGAGNETEAIWNRQVDGFWEIAWAVGDDPTLLDRRKNWRTHSLPAESGEQCTIMSGFQEISGYLRVHSAQRIKQDEFWQQFRNHNTLSDMDLRENERLCAIALIKRLFPKVSREAVGWQIEVANWPSTPYMAAVPFLAKALATAPEECRDYAATATQLCGSRIYGERSTRIHCLTPFRNQPLCGMDGDLFHLTAITDSDTRIPVLGERHSHKRATMEAALKDLQKATGGKASPFFAILLMDGDSLGAKLRDAGANAHLISEALATFTAEVPNTVANKDGVTIYAGGDDVLAILPVHQALNAAMELRHLYESSFASHCNGIVSFKDSPTISAGIVFAHFSLPLLDILKEAHRLLDKQAKEGMGRNAVAVGVYKGESLNSEWKAKWSNAANLGKLVDLMNLVDEKRDLSSSFVYRLREIMRLLDASPNRTIGETYSIPEALDIEPFISADLCKALSVSQSEESELLQGKAGSMAKAIVDVCVFERSKFNPDGIFLARFLSQVQRGLL